MGKRRKNTPSYLYDDDGQSNFAMLSSNLLASKAFQELSHAGRMFYIVCATHKQTPEQSMCLFEALKEYYASIGGDKNEYDIKLQAGQAPKAKVESKLFVIPQKQLEAYGYKPAYASKLKRELIDKGFITVFANEKKHTEKGEQGCNLDFSKRVTIYRFSDKWKKGGVD